MKAQELASIAQRNKILYSTALIGKDLSQALINAGIFLFSMQALGISPYFISNLFITQALILVVALPLLGMLLDITKSRFSKYKVFLTISLFMSLLSLLIIYLIPIISPPYPQLWFSCAYFMWSIFSATMSLSLWSTLSLFNDNLTSRDSMASLPCISQHIGVVFFIICVLPLMGKIDLMITHSTQNLFATIVIGAILILLSQGLFLILFSKYKHKVKDFYPHKNKPKAQDYYVTYNQTSLKEDYYYSLANNLAKPSAREHYSNYQNSTSPHHFHQNINPTAIPDENELNKSPYINKTGRNYRRYYQNTTNPFKSFSNFIMRHIVLKSIKHTKSFVKDSKENISYSGGIKEHINTFTQMVKRNDQLKIVFIISLLMHLIYATTYGGYAYIFIKHNLLNTIDLYAILAVGAILQIVSMSVYEPFVRRTSYSSSFQLSIYILIFGFSLLFFIRDNIISYVDLHPREHSNIFFTLLSTSYFIVNIAMGLSRVATTAMTLDIIDYGEFKLAHRTDGFIFALRQQGVHIAIIFSFFLYGGMVNLVNIFAPITHHNSFNIPFSLALSLIIVISLCVLALLIYINLYKLNGAFYHNVLNNMQYLRQHQLSLQKQDYNYANDRFMLRYSLDESTMIIKLKVNNVNDMIKAMVQKLSEVNAISSEHDYIADLNARLKIGPCGIADGIALPHAKSSAVRRATVVVATLDTPLDLGAMDDKKCDLVFLLASPDDGHTHLQLLGRLSLLLNEQGFADKLRTSGSPTELFERLIQCEKHIVR